jgi:glycolate oxidase iron-sulfur subunit
MENAQYLSELSRCVRCGTCKAICPTYEEISTEAMGARGRLALLWGLASGLITQSPSVNERIFSCTLCGACSGLCPPGVDIKEVIFHGRSLLRKNDKKRKYIRFLTSLYIRNPRLSFRLLGVAQHILFPFLLKKGSLPFRPELPDHHLKDNLHVFTVSPKRGRVAVFTGCTINFLYPHIGESLISVLHKLGYEVILPAGEVCCGAPLRTLGLEKEAKKLAVKNFGIFSRLNVEAVLSLCPTCTLTIKNEYPKLIGEGIEKAMDISSFFIDKIDPSQFSSPASFKKNAAYHDPCHLKYGLCIEREPREILGKIGIDLMDIEGERCCGFAGVFCLSNRELSRGILNKCINEYAKAGAKTIITSCPGCIMQLTKGIENKPVFHLIEVLEDSLSR